MTPGEHREACLRAMELAWLAHYGITPEFPLALKAMATAFDALPSAGACVLPTDATEEMIEAYRCAIKAHPAAMSPEQIKETWPEGAKHVFSTRMKAAARFRAMREVGKLTKPLEKEAPK
jgi:hypothetical protein